MRLEVCELSFLLLPHRCRSYPEVLLSQYVRRSGEPTGEIFFFEYGVVVFWDLSVQQETSILRVRGAASRAVRRLRVLLSGHAGGALLGPACAPVALG